MSCLATTDCTDGQCKPVVCEAGVITCNDKTLEQCNSGGTKATVVEDCASSGKTCQSGACVASVCTAGQATCKDGKVATCSANSLGWVYQACGAKQVCLGGACKNVVCTPYALGCDGKQVTQCDSLGTSATVVDDCGKDGKQCVQGACVK